MIHGTFSGTSNSPSQNLVSGTKIYSCLKYRYLLKVSAGLCGVVAVLALQEKKRSWTTCELTKGKLLFFAPNFLRNQRRILYKNTIPEIVKKKRMRLNDNSTDSSKPPILLSHHGRYHSGGGGGNKSKHFKKEKYPHQFCQGND
jgi:hypothetical protein